MPCDLWGKKDADVPTPVHSHSLQVKDSSAGSLRSIAAGRHNHSLRRDAAATFPRSPRSAFLSATSAPRRFVSSLESCVCRVTFWVRKVLMFRIRSVHTVCRGKTVPLGRCAPLRRDATITACGGTPQPRFPTSPLSAFLSATSAPRRFVSSLGNRDPGMVVGLS